MGKIFGSFRSVAIKNGAPKGNLKKHCEASKEYAEEQKKKEMEDFGFSYIEPQNVRFNRVLVDCPKSYNQVIKEYNDKLFGGRTMRKDGVPMIDSVFFYSPEKTKNLLCYFHKDNEAWKKEHAEWWASYEALTGEEKNNLVKEEWQWVQGWAKDTEEWASKNLGIVVHCVLHCHEATPHLDCKTLAIKEKEGRHIWAKREILGNKGHLSKMQTSYIEECGKKWGLERGEIRESGQLREHVKQVRYMVQKSEEELQAEIDNLKGQIGALQGYIKKTNKVLQGVMVGEEMDGGALWKNAIALYAEKNGLNAQALLKEVRQAMREESHNLTEEAKQFMEDDGYQVEM